MATKMARARMIAAALMIGVSAPATPTTLIRSSVEESTDDNSVIVVGEVTGVHSYWNDQHTFVLTDVHIQVHDSVKGGWMVGMDMVVTTLGGTVDGRTTLIVAGPELLPGKTYLLFLDEANVAGVDQALTTRDLCQAVFDVVDTGFGELRAVSQATRFSLLPDEDGQSEAPGGREGFPLDDLVQEVRQRVAWGGNGSR